MVGIIYEGSEEGHCQNLSDRAGEPRFGFFPSSDGHVGFDEEAAIDTLCSLIVSYSHREMILKKIDLRQ